MQQLNVQDVETLIDALTIWEQPDFAAIMGDMLNVGLASQRGVSEEQLAKIADAAKKSDERRQQQEKERQEKGIRLKAKLLEIRDELVLEQAKSVIKG